MLQVLEQGYFNFTTPTFMPAYANQLKVRCMDGSVTILMVIKMVFAMNPSTLQVGKTSGIPV